MKFAHKFTAYQQDDSGKQAVKQGTVANYKPYMEIYSSENLLYNE